MGVGKIWRAESLFLLLTFSVTTPLYGDTGNRIRPFAPVECPKIPTAYGALLDELSALRSQVSSAAHCEGIKLEVGQLEGIVRSERRERFLGIVRGNSNRILSPQDTDFLQRYAADVSDTSLRLMTLAERQGDCFPERNSQTSIAAVSSVVNETTSLLAQVAGPYGVPIVIGGNLLTGLLKGIQSFQNSRPGYRFHLPAERRTFTEQLCLYHQYRLQLDDLLYPEIGIRGMQNLLTHLQTKLIELANNCSECKSILNELDRDRAALARPEVKALVAAADARFRLPLGSETVQAWQTQAWAKQEIERLEALRALNNRSIGPQEIFLLRADFDQFFFERQAPQFLRWQLRQALEANHRFEYHTKQWTNRVLNEWRTNYGPMPFSSHTQLSERLRALAELEKRAERAEFDLFIESQTKQSADLLNLAWSAMQVIEDYCRFFRESRALSAELHSSCANQQLEAQRARLHPRTLLAGARPVAPASSPPPAHASFATINEVASATSEKTIAVNERSWTEGIQLEIERWTDNPSRYEPAVEN